MKLVRLLSVVFLGLSLTACGILVPSTRGDKVDITALETAKFCETTKSELIGLIGEPRQIGSQSGYRTASWFYSLLWLSKSEVQNVVAFFDDDNKLVDYAVNPIGLVQVNNRCK